MELGGGDHWVDMPASIVMMLCRQTTASFGRGSASQAAAVVRGQGGGRAWGISHALPGARRRMADLGPSWVPGIGSANDWPRRYACS